MVSRSWSISLAAAGCAAAVIVGTEQSTLGAQRGTPPPAAAQRPEPPAQKSAPAAGQKPAPPAGQKPAPAASQKPAIAAALDTQVRLDRAGFSPGEIDGVDGRNTTQALAAMKKAGRTLDAEPLDIVVPYVIANEDVAGPFTEKIPADMMAKSKLDALNYSTPAEALGEKFHASPALLQKLNPGARFVAGETIFVPNIQPRGFGEAGGPATDKNDKPTPPAAADKQPPDPPRTGARGGNPPVTAAAPPTTAGRGATPPVTGRGTDPQGAQKPAPPAGAPPEAAARNFRIVVSKSASTLQVLDEKGGVVFHAPVTSGSEKDPLPLGKWAVTAVARRPTFNYNPDLFWDANPAHAKAKIPPGPNNPVGLVWIDLTKEHYGIHGTPEPGKIGHTESHGCVRLTNWDALHVAGLVRKGTVVIFEP